MRRGPGVAVLVALAGCASLEGPAPFEVVEVVSPAALRVALPHGIETVHLEFVEPPAPDSDAWDEAIARIRSYCDRGVGVRIQRPFPLLRDHRERLECLITGPEDSPTLNETLLAAGLVTFAPDPVGPFYDESSACSAAATAAVQARVGLYAELSAEQAQAAADTEARTERALAALREAPNGREPLAAETVEAALARAVEALRLHGVELATPELALVDDEAFAAAVLGERAADPLAQLWIQGKVGFAPPGERVLIRERLDPRMHDEGLLAVLLLHELIHKVQYELGLVLEQPELDPELRRRYGTSESNERAPWLSEGHAQLWTGRLAAAAGFGDDFLRYRLGQDLLSSGTPYVEGAGYWRYVYDRLEDAGHAPSLRRGEDPLVDRTHAALLGPGKPRVPRQLIDPDPWLRAHVADFPAAPWRLEQIAWTPSELPGSHRARYRLTAARPLFVQLEDVEVRTERFVDGAWSQPGLSGHGIQGRFVLDAGATWEFDLHVDDSAERTRREVCWRGLFVSYPDTGEPGRPLVFGALSSPWVESTGD